MFLKSYVLFLKSYVLFLVILAVNTQPAREDTVQFKPMSKVNTFNVPLAKYPIVSWMDIQHGIYPNVYSIHNEVKVGSPLTILVYVSDINNLYDISAKDCYAYDAQTAEGSKHIRHITAKTGRNKHGIEWTKIHNKNESITLLHTNFTAFKFPERNKIYLTCNIQLCLDKCKEN